MKEDSSFSAIPELKLGGDEIYPNNPNERLISIPNSEDQVLKLAPFFEDVVDGKKMFFFVTIKFRDKSMAPNIVGVSETCGWFLKNSTLVHNCGVERL